MLLVSASGSFVLVRLTLPLTPNRILFQIRFGTCSALILLVERGGCSLLVRLLLLILSLLPLHPAELVNGQKVELFRDGAIWEWKYSANVSTDFPANVYKTFRSHRWFKMFENGLIQENKTFLRTGFGQYLCRSSFLLSFSFSYLTQAVSTTPATPSSISSSTSPSTSLSGGPFLAPREALRSSSRRFSPPFPSHSPPQLTLTASLDTAVLP